MMQNVNMRMGLQSWQIDRHINFDRDQENESLLMGVRIGLFHVVTSWTSFSRKIHMD